MLDKLGRKIEKGHIIVHTIRHSDMERIRVYRISEVLDDSLRVEPLRDDLREHENPYGIGRNIRATRKSVIIGKDGKLFSEPDKPTNVDASSNP
jgi:hypothetical protein